MEILEHWAILTINFAAYIEFQRQKLGSKRNVSQDIVYFCRSLWTVTGENVFTGDAQISLIKIPSTEMTGWS